MAPSESLRPRTDRLAALLADARGTEILKELQEIARQLRDTTAPSRRTPPTGQVGVWRLEHGPDGAALRRVVDHGESQFWADVSEVPLVDGTRRVVLFGESAARGWIYDPEFNPAMALERHLEKAAPGDYQVVDVARAGIFPEELTLLADQLTLLEPDYLIMFAGNNWAGLPLEPDQALLTTLSSALRAGGYSGLRDAFVDTVMLPRIHDLLDRLRALHVNCGTRIVVVIPEFNLQGWAQPPDIEVPVLEPELLAEWYRLRGQAVRALEERRWADVAPIVGRMRLLDDGMSPVPGTLLARAAGGLGDVTAVREGLEQARDSLIGVGVLTSPGISNQIHDMLTAFARENAFPCVDLRTVLAADGQLAPPDPGSFLDYCHLSDDAIEKTMSAVADAVLGLPPGTTTPGPGATKSLGAMVRLMAAAQCAYQAQPAEVVAPLLRAAIACDPEVTTLMNALLDVLESPGPVWTHAGLQTLAGVKSAREIFGPMLLSTIRADGMWTLRSCLGELLDRTPPAGPAELELLITADKMDRHRPDCAPRRAYRQATAERSSLAFALDRPADGVLHLTYRMPACPPDGVATATVNETIVGTFPSAVDWTGAQLSVPAEVTRAGVNRVHLTWPVPAADPNERHEADAATLARGGFPTVVPVFGELFEARLTTGAGCDEGRLPHAGCE